MATEHEARGAEDPTLLFEEYLELRDGGAAPRLEDFERRAGTRLGEFHERLGLLARMEELGRVLALDEDAGELPALESLGRYEVRGLLGQGGLSRVFLAHDPELQRDVALKVLSPTALTLGEARTWLLSEGRSLARLDHPSVVRVHEVGEARGFAYVAMERVRGPSLHAVLGALRAARDGQALADPASARAAQALGPVAERCRLVLRLARALAYCHARGVLHRDVKPGNVLLDEQHVPRLIDFGLAHHEREGGETFVTSRLFGTPAYLAPEQVDAGQSGARAASDQFALGVLLYELLTLEHPFARAARADTLTAISRADPLPPRRLDSAVHPDVERICLHALERLPARRYATVAALADDLEAFLEHRPISLRAPTPWHVAGLWARRHARQLAVAGVAVLVALGTAALVSWNVARDERRGLLTEVGERHARVAELADPREFEQLFDWIEGQRYRARELDGSAFAGSALPATLPAFDELWRAASRRVHEVAEPDFTLRARTIGSSARDDFFAGAYGRWQRALNAERAPEDAPGHDRALHEQGGLVLPEGGQLFALGGLPNRPTLVQVAPSRFPQAGTYRWVRTGLDGLEEVEFLHRGLEPRYAIAPRPVAPFLPPQLVPFEATDPPGDDAALEPFAIARRVVTWGELRSLLDEPELAPVLVLVGRQPTPVPLGDDDPAIVPWATAHELARRAGARLPTPVELWHALRSGRLDPPGPDPIYEWTSPHLGDDGHYLRLEGLAQQTAPTIYPHDDGDTTGRTGFRLARSLAH